MHLRDVHEAIGVIKHLAGDYQYSDAAEKERELHVSVLRAIADWDLSDGSAEDFAALALTTEEIDFNRS